jgi:hypothetical protein
MKKKQVHKTKKPLKNKIIKYKKCTAIESANRVEFIKKLRLAWYSFSDILINAKVKKWKISSDGILYYIAKADKEIKEYKKSDMPKWIKECEQKLIQLYLTNFQIGDFAECRRVLDTANKILGFEKLKVEIDKTETTTINVNIRKEVEAPERIEDVLKKALEDNLIPAELIGSKN